MAKSSLQGIRYRHPVIGVSAPVVRSWTELVGMLTRERVEVLELLHAVPRETALKLAAWLEEEEEEGVCVADFGFVIAEGGKGYPGIVYDVRVKSASDW